MAQSAWPHLRGHKQGDDAGRQHQQHIDPAQQFMTRRSLAPNQKKGADQKGRKMLARCRYVNCRSVMLVPHLGVAHH